MHLKNTSRYPLADVRRLIEFAAEGFDLRGVAVSVKNTKGAYRGLAYEHVPRMANVHANAKRLVTIGIGRDSQFPVDNLVTTRRWVFMPEYDGRVPDHGFVEDVLGLAYDTPEYKAWWREHTIETTHRAGVQTNRVRRLIVARHPYGGKGSPVIELNNWQEALVAIAAHEFTHIHQYQNNMPRSEVHAEKVAAKRLAAYRESIG